MKASLPIPLIIRMLTMRWMMIDVNNDIEWLYTAQAKVNDKMDKMMVNDKKKL